MTKSHLFFVVLLLWIVLYSCISNDVSSSLSSDQVKHLLNADDQKTWTLQSRLKNGEETFNVCLEENTWTFVSSTAGDSLYVLGRLPNCTLPSDLDTLFKANFTNEDFALSLSEQKHGIFSEMQIEEIGSSNLKLTYHEGDNLLVDVFGY